VAFLWLKKKKQDVSQQPVFKNNESKKVDAVFHNTANEGIYI